MKLLTLFFSLALAAPAFSQSVPQSFPARPVRIVVPFPPGGGAEFARFIREDRAKWAKLVRDAGIKLD